MELNNVFAKDEIDEMDMFTFDSNDELTKVVVDVHSCPNMIKKGCYCG